MRDDRSPIAHGLHAALRHWRLAGVLWAALALPSLVLWFPLGPATAAIDQSPSREALLKGWDSWGILSWLAGSGPRLEAAGALVGVLLVASVLLKVFLTGGLVRALIADVRRPVLARVVAESVALFRPNLRAFGRYLLAVALRASVFAGIPAWVLFKVAGKDAVPNGPLTTAAVWWGVLAGLGVVLFSTLRLDLARIALARNDSPTSRGAHRVGRARLRGSRVSALGLLLFWLAVGLAVQALFTNLGVRMNPSTGGGLFALVVVRQIGFLAVGMAHVGFWASLLAWEEARRPRAAALPFLRSVPAAPATSETA